MSGISPASCWITHKRLELWAKAAKERAWGSRNGSNSSSNSLEDFNVSKEQLNVQPPQNSSAQSMTAEIMKTPLDLCSSPPVGTHSLQHQSKSYPSGQSLLCRTPSASSQSSLDSTASKQGSHRGSSPQIRTFAPDGKVHLPHHGPHHYEASHTVSYPLQRTTSRSPSPHRAASLDIRSSSPGLGMSHAIATTTELRTPSPSQSSLASLTGGSGSSCNSPVPASPRTANIARCLSPLFIPPSRGATPDSASSAPPASPLGAIQPDLYVKKDGPLFIGEGKGGAGLGRLHFRLSYDFDRSDLLVHLIEAHDLAGSDQGGFNDPYVRLAIVPEVDTRKRQTAIHRNDPNPLFNQLFKFPVSHEELKSKCLLLQVFDYDRFSRNDIIGEVSMALSDIDIANSIEIWGEITKNKKPPEELQEILISLNYLPSAERLTLSIVKARNLFLPQDKDCIDPFVKVHLIVNGKRIKKKKTTAKKANCDPVWNEALPFNLSSSSIPHTELEISIYDQGNDIMGSNPLLGCCTIGPKSSGSGKEHWNDMMQSPRKTVFCWHTIRCGRNHGDRAYCEKMPQ
ncbi:synaptotagmin-5-like [Cylas formicarius]|uniref:synaptotagmin-5-like n=1 Tax=Cylas formicarius TaxID=197179 RepID=UPI0029585A78|nr:synaptotagmin-5-like [Cylas formicarius]XP_060532323.1 synaptotagmin-5-like [Cylas formicarius]